MMPQLEATQDPTKILNAFAEVLAQHMAGNTLQKAQTVGNPIGPYVHGPGGLFGVRGLDRDIISTHTQIVGSLGELLPIVPSNEMVPLFPYITGFLRSDTKEKNGVCENPPDANHFKTCITTAVWGRKEFKTRQLEINHVGQQINRGEFLDLQILNGPLVEQMGGLMRNMFGMSNQGSVLAGREMVMRLIEVGVAFQRWLCPRVFTGHPSNNAAGGGYKEFMGLQLLISRTKVDAETGQACPSLYSDIKSFNFRNVSSNADPDIVRTLTQMYRFIQRKAVTQNLGPVDLRFVMREPLFYEITRVWPCQYNTDGCNVGQNNTQEVNMNDNVRFRDDMRVNKYLLVDGYRVPVVTDDCIMEQTTADNESIPVGGYSSDIYLVPFSARGGTIRTLFWQYYDYSQALQAATDARAGSFFWSDGGAFLWHVKPPDNWCLEAIAKFEPRMILRTPQLAGRLQNVVYVPLQHTDDPLPSQPYWIDGGVADGRPFPSPYYEANLNGPGIQP